MNVGSFIRLRRKDSEHTIPMNILQLTPQIWMHRTCNVKLQCTWKDTLRTNVIVYFPTPFYKRAFMFPCIHRIVAIQFTKHNPKRYKQFFKSTNTCFIRMRMFFLHLILSFISPMSSCAKKIVHVSMSPIVLALIFVEMIWM